MIREHLVLESDNPVNRHDRNLTSIISIQKKVKRGRFAKNAEKTLQDECRVDPAVVEMVLDRYFNSPAREDWFNDVHEGAENLEPGQAQLFLSKHILKYKELSFKLRVIFEFCSAVGWDKGIMKIIFFFLALETYFRGNGVRMDVVRNLTVRDISMAAPVLTKCPFCKEVVPYEEHRPHCKLRKERLADGAEDPKQTTKDYAIKVRDHKTGNISGIG